MKPKYKKLNRAEKKALQKEKVANAYAGSGLFIFENNTNGELKLPKPAVDGRRSVGPNKQFQGDSFYHSWVKPPMNLLKFIREIIPVEQEQNIQESNQMTDQKLILDQPDQVTTEGTVEHVIEGGVGKTITDATNPSDVPENEVLLNEDPLDGVEILMG